MQSGGKTFTSWNFSYMDRDWHTLDPHEGEDMWRFKFLECLQENVLCQHVSEANRVRHEDIQSWIVFTHSSLRIENTTYGPPLGQSGHLVLEMEYMVKGKLKDEAK